MERKLITDIIKQEDFASWSRYIRKYLSIEISNARSKEEVKTTINDLLEYCIINSKKKDKLKTYLLSYSLLINYAFKFECVETLDNIIANINSDQVKQLLFGKWPVHANLYLGKCLFYKFNFLKDQKKFDYNPINLKDIIHAKYFLFRTYSNFLDKCYESVDRKLIGESLELLAGCFVQLNRWFEAQYYLRLAKKYSDDISNIVYLQARNLDAISKATCLDYSGLLLLQVIDYCRETYESSNYVQQIEQLKKLELNTIKKIANIGLKIEELRAYKNKVTKLNEKDSEYIIFCKEKMLFLSEHSLFCNCKLAHNDDLKISTKHRHTRIEWVKRLEEIVDNLVCDFIIARQHYYYGTSKSRLLGFNISLIQRDEKHSKIRAALLKKSFKSCYSILDQIGMMIFQILNIDYENKLKQQCREKSSPPKLYFLNMWDFDLIDDSYFKSNVYLGSLYSIAKDLDRTKYSALKGFKTIRNALEHKILLVRNEKNDEYETITNLRLSQKTELLLILTKSAIFSLVYMIRQESINIYNSSITKDLETNNYEEHDY